MSKNKLTTREAKFPYLGRLGFYHEGSNYGVGIPGASRPRGHLSAVVFDKDGRPKSAREYMSRWGRFWGNIRSDAIQLDLGTGVVTNVGVMAMANDFNWASPATAINILKLANYHATGTGATAAAATDIIIQTISTQGGQTPVAGAQSLVSAANLQKLRTIATISYTGGEAVTEWGLLNDGTVSSTLGSPATAVTATSLTATGTPFTASTATVRGQENLIVRAGTTDAYGLILSNTTSVLTIPAWYKATDGTAATTPGGTEAYTIRPVLWDRKVFSAINVVNGDSIQFTYTLQINSGG